MKQCTVVMAQHNRSDYSIMSLESLKNSGCDVDVIFVDSGSNEEELNKTMEYLKTYPLRYITMLIKDNISIGYNRNIALNAVRTPYVLSSDNDMEYHDNWLSESIRIFENSKPDVLGLYNHPLHTKVRDIDDDCVEMNMVMGGCWFSTPNIFHIYKFIEVPAAQYMQQIGEDTELGFRMRDNGIKFYSVKNNLQEHFGKIKSDGLPALGFN